MWWWSYVLTAPGVAGLLIAGKKNLWGWVLCIGSQVLWAIYGLTTNQHGFIIAAAIYTAVYGRNARLWWRDRTRVQEAA